MAKHAAGGYGYDKVYAREQRRKRTALTRRKKVVAARRKFKGYTGTKPERIQ